ncbi:MAG: AMP-binding protein [Thermoguttaceae bacterium]
MIERPKDDLYGIPQSQMIRACRKYGRDMKLVDSTGQELKGYSTLLRTFVFQRLVHKILAPREQEQYVGLLFPTTVYGAIVNAALAMDRRVAVNLNYTFGPDTINACIDKADIKHVFTTKRFLERFPKLKLNAEVVILEEAAKKITLWDKLSALIDTYFVPASTLDRKYGLDKIDPHEPLTIVFSSGSTGIPKGAVLSHNNITSNIAAFYKYIDIHEGDKILGVLPLFHGFGYSTTVWLPLTTAVMGIYHFNPLDAKKIGEMVRKYKPTAMPSTATFQRNFYRRCPKEDFENLPTIVCGAEKLPLDVAQSWEEKYGQPLMEGYGTTELSPVVSFNIDSSRLPDYQKWNRRGSVGRPLFNVEARVVDLDSGEVLPPNTPGMLQIKGPNVMLGYHKEPELTAAVLKDGWYTTGDLAKIDDDGFIWITGREMRISKIGGEMVPHILIEEAIGKIVRKATVSVEDVDEGITYFVAGLPDDKKGEKIVVLYKSFPLTPEEICKELQNEGLPNLWIPSPLNFRKVDEFPLLGTGKLDLRAAKAKAVELFAEK